MIYVRYANTRDKTNKNSIHYPRHYVPIHILFQFTNWLNNREVAIAYTNKTVNNTLFLILF